MTAKATHLNLKPSPDLSPSPRPIQSKWLGLGIVDTSANKVPLASRKVSPQPVEVEEFDFSNDLASGSNSDLEEQSSQLALPPPAARLQPIHPHPNPPASSTVFSSAAIVLSDDEDDDDDDDGDFDDLANDLEVSLAGQGPFAGPSVQTQQQQSRLLSLEAAPVTTIPAAPASGRPATAGKKLPQSQPFMDSDIASSSESESDDSASA